MKDIYQVIKKVRISEKATMLQETTGELVLEVDRDANKIEIKKAVEKLYGVTVTEVNTMRCFGHMKSKSTKKGAVTAGRTSTWKKAIVTVADGEIIDIYAEA